MSAQGPVDTVTLRWQGSLRFEARAGDHSLVLDSERRGGISPTQALALGLAGCMGIDVVDIIQKGRFALAGVETRLETERRPEPPRYVTRATLHFVVRDIDFRTSFEIVPAAQSDDITDR